MKLFDSTKRFPLSANSVDLVVTSPPYVTSYEYADLHQLTLFWLGDDKSRFPRWNKYSSNYENFRRSFVGTQHGIPLSPKSIRSKIALGILHQLGRKEKTIAKSVARYFIDMQKSFAELFRVVKFGKHACVIIGNTVIRNIQIKNAEIATELLKSVGFNIEKVIKREVANKMITPWRDKKSGKFTRKSNPGSRRIYDYEFVIIGRK